MKTLKQLLIAEATEYEFKAELELKKPKSWLKTVSAFANGLGGSIYFGVTNSGEVAGLADAQQVADKISALIRARIEPLLRFLLEPIMIDGKNILRLEVRSGQDTPYYYSADGSRVAFYRIGNESVQTPPHILNELILKGRHQSFDSLESRFLYADSSFTLLSATYKKETGHALQLPDDLISFGLLAENGDHLTHAGALLADDCRVYNSRIFCTRWNGLEKSSIFVDAVDDGEYSGNIITLLQNGLAFIRNNYKVKWRKIPEKRVEMPDYPQIAVREALVNAIIHRDLSFMGSEIHIDMYDDRLEITSPGGMVDGKRIQDMDVTNVPSKRRNPVIADLFQRLKLVERRGSGLKKIRKEYEGSDRQSVFFSDESWFITTLYNLNYGVIEDTKIGANVTKDVTLDVTKNNGRHKQIIELISTNGAITSTQLSEAINVTKRTILRDLEELRNSGIIARAGGKRYGRWEIVKNGSNGDNR